MERYILSEPFSRVRYLYPLGDLNLRATSCILLKKTADLFAVYFDQCWVAAHAGQNMHV